MDNLSLTVFIVLVASFTVYVTAAAVYDRRKRRRPPVKSSSQVSASDISEAGADVQPQKYCYSCMEELTGGEAYCFHCGKAIDLENKAYQMPVGTLIDGRYRIGLAMKESRSVTTYAARDEVLDMRVCLKEFFPLGSVERRPGSPDVICGEDISHQNAFESGKKKFMRDMRFYSRLGRATSAPVIRDMFSANGTPCVITDFAVWQPLSEYLRSNAPITAEYAVTLFVPLLRQIAAEHESGLTRCNITYENVCIFEDKLHISGGAVQGGSVPTFLQAGFAPEELYRKSGVPGAWTDVYSLSAVMYACMTGTVPDQASERIYDDKLKTLSQSGVAVTPAFENAIMKGLAIYGENRWQSCGQMLQAILEDRGQTFGGLSFIDPIVDDVQDGSAGGVFNMPNEPVDNDII